MTRGETGEHAVIVGASLAGLHAADAARRNGFRGRLTIVGAEPHRPYDRSSLSKEWLYLPAAKDATPLTSAFDLDAEWRLGNAAVRLDRRAQRLHLADGSVLPYDRLVIATGGRARPWPNQRERALAGLFTLRDWDDAARLRSALIERPERVVIVGAGFIGCEVAYAARRRGLPVTLVDRAAAPLTRVLGEQLGSIVAALLEEAGVEFRSHARVRRLEDDGKGRVIRALLFDGDAFDTTCVVAALGNVRNTEWLDGSGLSFDSGGLDCDGMARALDGDGRDETIFVAGDVARFPHSLYGRVCLEHWDHAAAHGAFAGAMLAGDELAGAPYATLPSFRMALGAYDIRAVGMTECADAITFADGSPKAGRFVVVYGQRGVCVAAVAFAMPEALPAYARLIASGAPFPPRAGLSALPPDFV